MTAAGSSSTYTLDGPNWRLQHLGRADTSSSYLSSGGFAKWTDVPPVGVPDPVIADQNRVGRRHLTGPTSGPALEPMNDRGKRMASSHPGQPGSEGKRPFPEVAGVRSTNEVTYRGVKHVESRARRDTAGIADPNAVAAYGGDQKPESVKMYDGRNQVQYQAWKPDQLGKAEYGDWNWNTQQGFRRVYMTASGEPKRTDSTPVAFPGYKGYPPDRNAATGTRIDYVRVTPTLNASMTYMTLHSIALL